MSTPEPSRSFNFTCDDDDDDEEYSIPLNKMPKILRSIALAPVSSTIKPEDSLIMGDEHLSTIPETESDEVIKSSVEDLVLIPSESEDTSGTTVDIKAINIILQGLPTEIYALVIYIVMNSINSYKKGDDLHDYDLRFTLLLNDMNIYKMPLEQFQVNTKFLNTLPDEWSKFVTDVKLVKDLHTTNVDQLHAYLQQHEKHANEVGLMHERNSDPLALVASHQLTQPAYQSHLHTHPKSLSQLHVSPYQSSQFVTTYQT
ncbi:hypothetical protein Tco_0273981 [Tanacetum coccineum]